MTTKLDKLAAQLFAAKTKEANARAAREDIEALIYRELERTETIPERGTLNAGPVKVVFGVSEKWDQDKLRELQQSLPAEQFPFTSSFRCDRRALTKLATDDPQAYRKIHPALTTKPRKPTFQVVEHSE